MQTRTRTVYRKQTRPRQKRTNYYAIISQRQDTPTDTTTTVYDVANPHRYATHLGNPRGWGRCYRRSPTAGHNVLLLPDGPAAARWRLPRSSHVRLYFANRCIRRTVYGQPVSPRPARVEAGYGTACRPRAPRASDTRASRLASACRRRTTCSAASIAFSSRCAVAGSTARRYRAVSSSVKRGDGGQRCSRKPQRQDGERRTRGFNSPHTRGMHVLARGIPTFSPRHLVLTQEL